MIEYLAGLPVLGLFAVAALVLAAESGSPLGLFLPGSPTLLALGVLSGEDVVSPWTAVLVAGSASALGAQWGFLRARRLRLLEPGSAALLEPPSRRERGLIRRVGPERVRRLLAFLGRRAVPAVALGHVLSGARTVMPRLAGRAGVSHRRFTAANAPTAFAWVAVVVGLGQVAGAAYEQVETAVGLAGLPVVLLAGAVVAVVLLVRRRRDRERSGAV
ncbi:DedA family protein [Saccharopolyspora sp. MS10]|uniref:DedA family protein n=1 Tax=Saccharopolyspora sp. MS10 TaxID=3385973 RepID=UPI0039A08057